MELTIQECQEFDIAYQLLERLNFRIETRSARDMVSEKTRALHLEFQQAHATPMSAWDYMAEWRWANKIKPDPLPQVTIGEWMLCN